MKYRFLGSSIEYEQAAKRLEELSHAPPGSSQAQERKELIQFFLEFEKEILRNKRKNLPAPKFPKS